MDAPLTKRQRCVYEFIESYIHEKGFGPTVREIAEAVNLSSPSTVHVHLKTLEEKGRDDDTSIVFFADHNAYYSDLCYKVRGTEKTDYENTYNYNSGGNFGSRCDCRINFCY